MHAGSYILLWAPLQARLYKYRIVSFESEEALETSFERVSRGFVGVCLP